MNPHMNESYCYYLIICRQYIKTFTKLDYWSIFFVVSKHKGYKDVKKLFYNSVLSSYCSILKVKIKIFLYNERWNLGLVKIKIITDFHHYAIFESIIVSITNKLQNRKYIIFKEYPCRRVKIKKLLKVIRDFKRNRKLVTYFLKANQDRPIVDVHKRHSG